MVDGRTTTCGLLLSQSVSLPLSVGLLPGSCGTPDRILCCVLSKTESNRSDAYGKEAEEADCKKAEKTKEAKSDWTGFPTRSWTLRNQVDEALTGYRSTLERQLEALGSSVASLGGKVARGIRGSTLKGRKVAAEISRDRPESCGLDVAQRQDGWLRQSKKAKSWKIF